MIGKARRERRRQARAAIERYEYQHANDQLRVEAAEQRAKRAEQAEREQAANLRGMAQRLDDANAELARWGLEPVTRDGAESDEHPQRYRRASDWRTYRSGTELVELLERSGIDPDATVVQEAAIPRATPEYVEATVRYESDAPVVAPFNPEAAAARTVLAERTRERDDAREQIEWLRNAREGDLAVLASELGWPGEDPVTASGLCLRVRDVLAAALEQRRELERGQAELLDRLNAHRDSSAALADAHADAKRARAMATELGLERDALSAALREAEEDRLRVMRELGDALTAASDAEGERDRLRAELASRDPGEGWIELAEFEAQRTEAERLERLNDRLRAEVSRLTLLQENLTPLPPAQGDVITVNLRDGRTQRCTVRSVMPVGDLGFSLSLEPESPPL